MRFLVILKLLVATLIAASAELTVQNGLVLSISQDTIDTSVTRNVVPVDAHAIGGFGGSASSRPTLMPEPWELTWNETVEYDDVKRMMEQLDVKMRKAIKEGVASSKLWEMMDKKLENHPNVNEMRAKVLSNLKARATGATTPADAAKPAEITKTVTP